MLDFYRKRVYKYIMEMINMNTKLRKLIFTALFAALTFIATYAIPIKIPGGYIHPGDAVIITASLVFGPYVGSFAGGIGAALADLTGGYVEYIIPTLIIKVLLGLIFGVKQKNLTSKIIVYTAGLIILAGGYYIADIIIFGNFATPLASLPFNCIQYVFGAIFGTLLAKILNKIKRD